MAGKKRSLLGVLNWFVHSWYLPAAIIVLLVLGVILWALPWRTDLVVSTDDSHRWFAGSAPPRRKVVWEPPQKVVNLFAGKDKGSFITPRLIDHGATLYFSYCPEEEGKTDFDIYRSRLLDGIWQPAEAVKELNTPDDDICFSFSPNGRTMYLYSSHAYPGAQGQFDIYVSRRVKTGWSTPENLGPKVNSDYDEFEPAVAPDGKTLVFASNRTLKDKNKGAARKRWVATLRADLGQAYFDLYAARREGATKDWAQAQPIVKLNKKDFKDGSPYFSPSGEFLYFASNRPVRAGEPPNLDLFRARFVTGKFEVPENLGDVVNTREQETEPGLSPEGFTLLFSSDREGADVLYSSKAVEVYHTTEWDDGRWAIFASLWWKVLGLLLALALLAYIVYRLRHWLFQKATAARFLVVSLILHLLFVILMGFVAVVSDPDDIIRAIFVEPPPQTQVFETAQDQPSYEKVADLKALEQANLPEMVRQAVNAPAPPQTMQKNVTASANIPVQINPIAPSQKFPQVKPLPQRSPPTEAKLAKNRSLNNLKVAMVNPIDLKLPPEIKQQILKQITQGKVDLDRRKPAETPTIKPVQPAQPRPAKFAKITPLNYKPAGLAPPKIDIPKNIPKSLPKKSISKVALASPMDQKVKLALPPATNDSKSLQLEPQSAAVSIPRQGDFDSKTVQIAQSKNVKIPMVQLPRRVSGAPIAAKIDDRALSAKGIADPLQKKTFAAAKSGIAANPAAVDPNQLVIEPKSSPTLGSPELAKIPPVRAKAGPLVPSALSKQTPLDLPLVQRLGVQKSKSALPSVTPIISPLDAKNVKRTLPPGLKIANAKPVTQQRLMFMLRNKETKKQATKIFGGTKQSEEAVELGLKWLAKIQESDGSWRLQKFQSGTRSQTAGTAFGLLPFLGAGYSHKTGKYKETVAKGLQWLVKNQKKDGDLHYRKDNRQHQMYAHGLAAIALCEAYGMTKDPALRDPAQRAVNFIVAAQHKSSGGWRYRPRELGDTSVMGWQIMALKSGQMAGLMVPQSVFDGAKRWLKRVESGGREGGQFGYQSRGARPTMTAQGLLALELMGIDRDSPRLQAGVKYILKYLPKRNSQSSYYYYHATQVMYHMQGDFWKTWNSKIRDLNVNTQIKSGRNAGSWNPTDNWERSGGRIMATSLRLLMLEVYYRHLPLYQQLEG